MARKSEFVIQVSSKSTDGIVDWLDVETERPILNTADAEKYLKEQTTSDTFRIIAVKKIVHVEAETRVKITEVDG